jgi:uncharacterized Zn finger protein (UPF0148 family)
MGTSEDASGALACMRCGTPIPGVTEQAEGTVDCPGCGQSYQVANLYEYMVGPETRA